MTGDLEFVGVELVVSLGAGHPVTVTGNAAWKNIICPLRKKWKNDLFFFT